MDPTREIGLNWSSVVGSLTLGTSAMEEALHPFGMHPVS